MYFHPIVLKLKIKGNDEAGNPLKLENNVFVFGSYN